MRHRKRCGPTNSCTETGVGGGGTDMTTVAEIERELAELRGPERQHVPHQRTSVMTHLAWVPQEWVGAARDVLAGLAERHPSRTIVLVPQPDADRDEIEGDVRQQCFPLAGST